MEIFLAEKKERVAEATLFAYAASLKAFEKAHSAPKDATSDEICAYLSFLCERATRPTVARALTALRGYYRSLKARGEREDDPTEGLVLARFSPAVLAPLEKEVFDALLQAPFQGIRGMRDRIMLFMLRQTDLTVSELVSLRRCDLVLDEGKIMTKNGCVSLSPFLCRALSEYDAVTALLELGDTDPLFVNEKGEGITRQGFWKAVKIRALRADLPEEVTLRGIRSLAGKSKT